MTLDDVSNLIIAGFVVVLWLIVTVYLFGCLDHGDINTNSRP